MRQHVRRIKVRSRVKDAYSVWRKSSFSMSFVRCSTRLPSSAATRVFTYQSNLKSHDLRTSLTRAPLSPTVYTARVAGKQPIAARVLFFPRIVSGGVFNKRARVQGKCFARIARFPRIHTRIFFIDSRAGIQGRGVIRIAFTAL